MVAFLRALTATESKEEIRGRDYLAEIFLSDNLKKILKDPGLRKWAMKNQASGMYACLIARTIYFDHITERALRENIPQIVILGRGTTADLIVSRTLSKTPDSSNWILSNFAAQKGIVTARQYSYSQKRYFCSYQFRQGHL